MIDARSVSESYVYVLDAVDSGKRTRVLPREGETPAHPIASSAPQFSRDGKGLFLTDRSRRRVPAAALLDLASGALEYFGDPPTGMSRSCRCRRTAGRSRW